MWSQLLDSDDSDDESNVASSSRLPRNFRDRINTEFRTEYEFNERFRMTSHKMEELMCLVGPFLEHPTHRSEALSAKLQLCIALHWLGSGGQYHTVADMHGVSKATICRAVHSLVDTVNTHIFENVVKWPVNIGNVVTKFHNLARMPMVIGCIDGTLIKIDAPKLNEEHFVDRHGDHSINCMAVCGPDCQFYFVSARWPGSVHDSRVLRNSTLYRSFQNGWRPIPGGFLLGDSGYPLLNWLLIPKASYPPDPAVQAYNKAHKSTRRVVENSFGILKEKFPCLNYLRLNPEFSCKIFKCCAALLNIIRTDADEEAVRQIVEVNEDQDEDEEEASTGESTRLDEIIAHFR